MTLEEIQERLTEERVAKEVAEVRATEFSSALEPWIERYRRTGDRDDFVFRWCYKINKSWVLVPVRTKYETSLEETKTLFNMFIVLVDDISEKRGKEDLLGELVKIPFYPDCVEPTHLSRADREYLEFVRGIWEQIRKNIGAFPACELFGANFSFDVRQLLSAFEYGYFLVQNHQRMNETEYWIYFPNSMQIIINADLDLMCSTGFKLDEIGKFREAILLAQKMARIGNWLTTWEREVQQGDYTSIVIPHALRLGVITHDDISRRRTRRIVAEVKKARVEEYFLRIWEEYHRELRKELRAVTSIDAEAVQRKFEYLIFMHLLSKGLK